MFYWCLLNLPLNVRYNLVNIKLLAISKSDYLNEQNVKLLLTDFIETANKLYSTGIEFIINGELQKLFGIIVFALGDTLGLQWLGGFVEGVGKANKFCRTCEITAVQKLENPKNIYSLRSEHMYLLQIELIKRSPDLTKQYGIKYPSPLLGLSHFDVTKCLLHDPMHVLVEGVCIRELQNLLKNLVDEKGIQLEKINDRISSFSYSRIDSRDKPNIIKYEHIQKGSFAQSAGQMMVLFLNFPFIIGDFWTEYDDNWLNFINLHQILNIVYSFSYDNLTINQLEMKINSYLSNFKILYENVNFTPKMHYLTHFPSQMENFGPLRLHSCFRFESKNGLIAGFNYQNFTNIAFSSSNKHQLWIASKELEFKIKNSLTYIDDICDIDDKDSLDENDLNTFTAKKYISVI
jgi:hypothetical protein